ncbi:MAG: ABC transporter substrate-binding protein [Pseudomonadota bacterium]
MRVMFNNPLVNAKVAQWPARIVVAVVMGFFVSNAVGQEAAVAESTVAEDTTVAPDELIRDATDKIVSAIEQAKKYYDTEPERFHAAIDEILFPLIDFRSFARGVMGKHGSRRYESTLKDDAAKQVFQARVDAFTEKFKQGLVATYAKGLLTFQGETIDVLPVGGGIAAGKSVNVVQKIHGDGSEPVLIRYKMRQNTEGLWKVRNVQLQSINLGKVYRNQFASAVRQYNSDIDKVIENWVVESQDVE